MVDKHTPLIQLIQLQEVQEFISIHQNEEAASIVLRYASKEKFDVGAVALQISLRKKAEKKIREFITPFTILLPKLYEQCTNERVAKFKSSLIGGHSLLNATTGLGIDSYYIGKSFKEITCLEANPEHSEILIHNYKQLEFKAEVIPTQLEDFLQNDTRNFDAIYIDPDRRPDAKSRVFEIHECMPNVLTLKDELLKRAKTIWIKLSPMIDLQAITQSFGTNLRHVHCIAQNNEMKEILVCIEPGVHDPIYEGTNLSIEQIDTVTLTNSELKPLLSGVLKYFFEPNVALIKSKIAMEYAVNNELFVLYSNGYYFTTNHKTEELYGRIFEVIAQMPYKKDLLQQFVKTQQITKANISSRNFFWKPEEIKKQLKLNDGGAWYLFCYNNSEKQPIAVWCKKT